MRILIVGNGGREHALLWKLRQDAPGALVYATRPNGGMAPLCEAVEIAPTDVEALAGFASSRAIDLTIIGPEAPLAMGIADRFHARGLPVFGPTRAAARIESSKAFAKELMREEGVPTADYRIFTDADAAEGWIRERGAPIVVKASGLAAGKGAIVCATVEEAVVAARAMLEDFTHGEAGREIVIEECMEGEELSVFGVSDGEEVVLLLPSQDHKRVGEGDTGPNTGGMGAYAPVSLATPALLTEIRERIFRPVLQGLARRGAPFRGLLYAGLMLTERGPRVVEFNGRFGDPETQVLLPLMSSSLIDLLVAAAEGTGLRHLRPRFRPGAAVTTVVASRGYPGPVEKGHPVTLPALDADQVIFHGGTRRDGERLVTSGGRVVSCTGIGDTLAEAAAKSRAAAAGVRFAGASYRTDIGWRELARQPAPDTNPE